MNCTAEGCETPATARSLCGKHLQADYAARKRAGLPTKVLLPCGTRAAYDRHRARMESICRACATWQHAYAAERWAARSR